MLIAPDLAIYKVKVWLDEQTRNAYTRKHILKSLLAWVATVSLWFRSKERHRNDEERDFFNLAARKMESVFDSHPLFFAAKPLLYKTLATSYAG